MNSTQLNIRVDDQTCDRLKLLQEAMGNLSQASVVKFALIALERQEAAWVIDAERACKSAARPLKRC